MKKGFTLVELIVVVIIIGILAAVGVPQLRRTLERARGAEALSGLGHIQSAQKVYYALNERYLATPSDQTIQAIQNALDINIAEENWEFMVTTSAVEGNEHQKFMATAGRKGGPCDGRIIPMDQDGMITEITLTPEQGWNACLDSL